MAICVCMYIYIYIYTCVVYTLKVKIHARVLQSFQQPTLRKFTEIVSVCLNHVASCLFLK